MAKKSNVTIDLDFDFLKPDKTIDKATGRVIGRALRKATIKSLSKGQSPVRGQKRLEKYKDPKKYPGKKKPKRPVNLKLSGAFYNSLSFIVKKGVLSFGLLRANAKVKLYMEVHNTDMPIGKRGPKTRRAWLPLDGEEYQVKIMRDLRLIISRRIDILIKKANKR
jgi:hypothetical protein